MKTLVIILFSILFITEDSAAQTVFAPKGAVWNYYREGDSYIFNSKYSVEKDTIYEGYNCAKVIGEKTFLDGSKEILKTNYFYTIGDTVFYYHDSLKNFTPLYIFDVKLGDTIHYAAPISMYPSLKEYTVVITKIETNIVDGFSLKTIYHKVINPVAGYIVKYTERFGGYYLANIIPIIGPTTTGDVEGIRCYRDQEIDEKFVSDKWDCDYVPTNIDENIKEYNVQIFPNPVVDKITVRLPENAIEGQYNITGIDGRMLIQQNYYKSNFEIDLSSLSNGIYFLQLGSPDIQLSKAISVIH